MIATVKHYAANNSELDRNHFNSVVDERTLREIYLPVFEAAVKEGRVGAVMNSYNLLNGQHATESDFLNLQVLKKEWGFRGILMSDWGATHDGIRLRPGAGPSPWRLAMDAVERTTARLETIVITAVNRRNLVCYGSLHNWGWW